MDLPTIKIKRRAIDLTREKMALENGLDPLIARIMAGRAANDLSPIDFLEVGLKQLDNPQTLADIQKAANRLGEAILNNEVIGIETDHDCDGQTSHAVIYAALIEVFEFPPHLIRSYIGHRLKEGYGLSESVMNRILEDSPRPTLVITADNGSGDEERIKILKENGIAVIVTDHHEIPEAGIPQSAYAVVNPTRQDSQYPDKYIAGCMVAWLLMAATRQALMTTSGKTLPSLGNILDFVAVGTVADCVSMARSLNNRAIVSFGIKLIQKAQRPCWRALLEQLTMPLCSEDLGFKIGPLLNSDGRLACAFGSVSFLLAKTDKEAKEWIQHLQIQNTKRKEIQAVITAQAFKEAALQCQQGKASLCLFLEEGHAGVHGISASRIKDRFGRPVIIFCPKTQLQELLTGSARGIEGVHLKEILQKIQNKSPGLMEKFGGHQGAAGLTLNRVNLALFSELFEIEVKECLKNHEMGPVLWTDGELPSHLMEYTPIKSLMEKLEPFGREFDPPLFEITGQIKNLNIMGQQKNHLRLTIESSDVHEFVWFNARQDESQSWPVQIDEKVHIAYSLRFQSFRGQPQLTFQVQELQLL